MKPVMRENPYPRSPNNAREFVPYHYVTFEISNQVGTLLFQLVDGCGGFPDRVL